MTAPVIMCVDDDPGVLDALVRDLENTYPKFEIEACESGAEALEVRDELLEENRPIALYIVDSRMPGMTGIEFLKQVREDTAGRIMLTAYSDIEVAVEGINTRSIDFYLNKPYGEELFRRIDDILYRPTTTVEELTPITPDEFKDVETPYFMFDLDKIKDNINLLKTHVKPDKILYAIKCNSLEKVVETVYNQGAGFEINNRGEYAHVKKLLERNNRVDIHHMVNSHPLCNPNDVKFFHGLGLRQFCFDNKSQIRNLTANAPGASAYIRIYNDNKGSRFKLNRLGAKQGDAGQLVAFALENGINVNGVTFHVGSQCGLARNWRDAIRQAAELFRAFPTMKILNIGGGFPTVYKRDMPEIQEIGALINESISEFFERRPVLYVEPGRFVVGNAAYACSTVTHVDDQNPVSRASVDMSVFSGLIEILEIKDDGFAYPIITDSDKAEKRYQIVGTTCAGTDIIADEILLNELHADCGNPKNSSKIYFLNTGAYTLDYIGRHQASGFNGARTPQVFYIEDGELVTTAKNRSGGLEIRVVTSTADPLWKKCERVEYEVFESEGYVGTSPDRRIDEFDAYQRCEFVAALDQGRVIGAMRLVYSNAEKMGMHLFPTLNHAKLLAYTSQDARENPALKPPYVDNQTLWLYPDIVETLMDARPDKMSDLSTMAIKRNRRDAEPSKRIITNVMYRGWRQNIKMAIGAIDTPFYLKLKRRGLPFIDLGPSVEYWGSETTPTLLADTHSIVSGVKKMVIPYMQIQGFVDRIFS